MFILHYEGKAIKTEIILPVNPKRLVFIPPFIDLVPFWRLLRNNSVEFIVLTEHRPFILDLYTEKGERHYSCGYSIRDWLLDHKLELDWKEVGF